MTFMYGMIVIPLIVCRANRRMGGWAAACASDHCRQRRRDAGGGLAAASVRTDFWRRRRCAYPLSPV
jgi:hypothetical protein